MTKAAAVSFITGVVIGILWSNFALYLILSIGAASLLLWFSSKRTGDPRWVWRHSKKNQDDNDGGI